MDIEPSQKRQRTLNDVETDEPFSKRQKLCNETPDESKNNSKKTSPIASDEPIVDKDSNTKVF